MEKNSMGKERSSISRLKIYQRWIFGDPIRNDEETYGLGAESDNELWYEFRFFCLFWYGVFFWVCCGLLNISIWVRDFLFLLIL